IYRPLYGEYSRLFDQPLIIGEFASASAGGNKVAWIQKMFDQIGQYDRIKLAIWWNYNDYNSSGAILRNYRMDDSLALKETFRQGLELFKSNQN
ncbi:MAG: hypothetical protein E6713_18770, partial [Sporomusaceae bacterium]|nr:hypothetical protein [Sporomusaceae bacterium]